MSSLVIFFVATIAVIVPLTVVESADSGLDVNSILELVRQQQRTTGNNKQRRQPLRQDTTDSDSESESEDDDFSDFVESDDSDYNRIARLRKDKIIDLLQNVASDKKYRIQNDDRKVYRKEKINYNKKNIASRGDKYDNPQRTNNIQSKILEQLLTEGINEEDRKRKPRQNNKKSLKPNRLVSKITRNDIKEYNKHSGATGLEDYSKVYIVLNPQAVRKSKNKNSLNDLVSKVLALSSPSKSSQGKRKQLRYKGFLVKDDHLSRRSRRESKEIFAPRDSMDDDYKQKHSRNNGGGGGNGHTAIPYIKHRGDIYERDN